MVQYAFPRRTVGTRNKQKLATTGDTITMSTRQACGGYDRYMGHLGLYWGHVDLPVPRVAGAAGRLRGETVV